MKPAPTEITSSPRPAFPDSTGSSGPTVRRTALKGARIADRVAETVIKSISFLSFAVIILILVFVFREALPIFFPAEHAAVSTEELQQETYGDEPTTQLALPSHERQGVGKSVETVEGDATLKNLAGSEWQPVSARPKFGLLPLIVGSFKVTFIAIAIGAPLAILAALYTVAFAPRRMKEIIKPSIEMLSGFPSVVIGFFSLVAMASVLQDFFGYQYRLNAFVGGLALSLAVIPMVYTVAEDSLSAIPKFMTEASLAIGATRWQTALFVVLPAATPGVFAAILLGIGRAFGETMIVLMATGNASLMSADIFEPVRTMSATIGAEMAEVVFGDTHYNVLFLIGSILFIFTFALNAVAEFYVRARLIKRFRGQG